jgi:hypothetical protein
LPPFGGNDLPALPANAIIKVPGEVVQSTTYTRVSSVLGDLKSWRIGLLARIDAMGRSGPAYRGPQRLWRWANYV